MADPGSFLPGPYPTPTPTASTAPTGAPPPIPPPPPFKPAATPAPEPVPSAAFITEFEDRVGNFQFQAGNKGWGYLPQLHEWAAKGRTPIEWVVTRIGGEAHQPDFEAYPIWCGQHLRVYTRKGPSKQAAKESSAQAVALSGHCLSCPLPRRDSGSFNMTPRGGQCPWLPIHNETSKIEACADNPLFLMHVPPCRWP